MRRFLLLLCVFALGYLAADDATVAKGCPFCNPNIIEKQSLLKLQHICVLLDHAPRVDGHLLVITKRHLAKAHELSIEEWNELGMVVPQIAAIFAEHLGTDQYILLEKNGPIAFQDIPHVHFHLIPMREAKARFGELLDPIPRILTDEEMQEKVQQYRNYFIPNVIQKSG